MLSNVALLTSPCDLPSDFSSKKLKILVNDKSFLLFGLASLPAPRCPFQLPLTQGFPVLVIGEGVAGGVRPLGPVWARRRRDGPRKKK